MGGGAVDEEKRRKTGGGAANGGQMGAHAAVGREELMVTKAAPIPFLYFFRFFFFAPRFAFSLSFFHFSLATEKSVCRITSSRLVSPVHPP